MIIKDAEAVAINLNQKNILFRWLDSINDGIYLAPYESKDKIPTETELEKAIEYAAGNFSK